MQLRFIPNVWWDFTFYFTSIHDVDIQVFQTYQYFFIKIQMLAASFPLFTSGCLFLGDQWNIFRLPVAASNSFVVGSFALRFSPLIARQWVGFQTL